MKKYLCAFSLSILFIHSSARQAVTADQDTTGLSTIIQQNLPAVRKIVEKKILPSRYMSVKQTANLIGTTDTIPGWEGFPVQLYEYRIADKKDTLLTTRVYLLNADAERTARWIISACWMEKKKVELREINIIVNQIDSQSGGQFPIRGIVYEDLKNDDGIQETYVFFDGVSVGCKGIHIRTPQRATKEEQHQLLSMRSSDIDTVFTYGRIISTKREEYALLFPQANVKGKNWCNIVREEYKKALKSDINYLINAWVRANLK